MLESGKSVPCFGSREAFFGRCEYRNGCQRKAIFSDKVGNHPGKWLTGGCLAIASFDGKSNGHVEILRCRVTGIAVQADGD